MERKSSRQKYNWIDALKQQKLPASRPNLHFRSFFQVVFSIGFMCIAIGTALTISAKSIKEEIKDYSNYPFNQTNEIPITIKEDFNGEVFIYYQLENYQQNYRLMVNSYDFEHFFNSKFEFNCTGQTKWTQRIWVMVNIWCDTFERKKGIACKLFNITTLFIPREQEKDTEHVVPCGRMAYTMFNDTIKIRDSTGEIVPFTNKNITWPSYFTNNPENFKSVGCDAFPNTTKPESWPIHICNMSDGMQNEAFLVWMRPAARSTFRKIWMRLEHKGAYNKSLPSGDYTIIVENNYPTKRVHIYNEILPPFTFKKSIVITTVNWAGGSNNFLGVAYTVVGVIIILTGIGMAFIHCRFGNQLDEDEYTGWRKYE